MKIYNKAEMVEATFNYCERVIQVPGLDLENDTIAIELDKADILNLLSDGSTVRIVGVFGLDPSDGKQSIFLIPVDSSGKATMGGGNVQGAELWPGRPPLKDIIGPDDITTNSNLNAYYSTFE